MFKNLLPSWRAIHFTFSSKGLSNKLCIKIKANIILIKIFSLYIYILKNTLIEKQNQEILSKHFCKSFPFETMETRV